MNTKDIHLTRDAFGQLLLSVGEFVNVPIIPVRSFPISAPDQGISLVATDGTELLWLDSLDELPEPVRAVLKEDLDSREFTPEIQRILSISSFATPSHWQVQTDRGEVQLVLKGEEDIRRLSASTLLIADYHGVYFLIRDVAALDKASRRLLDHFL